MASVNDSTAAGVLLTSILAQVPVGTNPYTYILEYFTRSIFPGDSPAKKPLYYTISALACVPVLLLISSMIVRWRKGSLWFFRVIRTSDHHTYVLPHYVTSWSCWLIVLCAIIQASIWSLLTDNAASGASMIEFLTWEPVFLALSALSWTLCVTYILHLKTFHPTSSTSLIYHPHLVHALAALVPGVHLAVTVTLAVRALHIMEDVIAGLTVASTEVYAAALSWDGFSEPTVNESWVQLGFTFLLKWEEFIYRFDCLLWWEASTCLAFSTFLVFVAVHYIKVLSKQMQSNSSFPSIAVQGVDFRRTRRWLIFVTTAFIVVLTLVVAVIFVEAGLGDRLFKQELASLVGNSFAFYVPVVSCIPVSIVLLIRALRDPAQSPSSSRISRSFPPRVTHHLSLHPTAHSADPPASPFVRLSPRHPFSITRLVVDADADGKSKDAAFSPPTISALDNFELHIVHPDPVGFSRCKQPLDRKFPDDDCFDETSGASLKRRSSIEKTVEGVLVTKEVLTVVDLDDGGVEEDLREQKV